MLTGIISLIGMALLVFIAAHVLRGQMMGERIVKIRNLTEVARGVIAYHHGQVAERGEAAAKASAIAEIRNLRYLGSEYFFIYTEDGTNVLIPPMPEREGKNFLEMTDDRGTRIIRALLASAHHNGEPVFYRFPKAGSIEASDKMAIALPFEPWGWVVGTGVYVDDLDAEFLKGLVNVGWFPFLVTLFAVAAIFAIARSVSQPLQQLSGIIERLSDQDFDVLVPFIERPDEIGAIARAMAAFKINGQAFQRLQQRERNRHAEILEAHQRLSLQIRRMPVGYMVWDARTLTLTEWNPAAEKIFGWSAEEVLGKPGLDLLVGDERRRRAVLRLTDVVGTAAAESHWTDENVTKDGRLIVCEWFHSPLRDGSGAITGCLSMVQDITARKVAEERLRASEQRLMAITDSAPANIWLVGRDYLIGYANNGMNGRVREDFIGTAVTDWIADDYHGEMLRLLDQIFTGGEAVHWECRGAEQAPGEWYDVHIAPVFEGAEVTAAVMICNDISDRRAAEAKAEFLAYHDPLTQLPNRVLGKLRFDLALAHAKRTDSKTALLLIDLDNFKQINDSLGHVAGDELLKAVAQRLLECIRGTDLAIRQGGDEFLVLLTNIHGTDDAASAASKILERFQPQFLLGHETLPTSVSIGAVVYPEDGETFDVLLKKASSAVASAKEAGRNTYRFFTEQMNDNADEYLRIRTGLQQALEKKEFVLFYQPQIDMASGDLVGAEALIRWQHPEFGLLAPGRFIAVAEESGLILSIGEWVLNDACQQAVAWRRAGLPPITVAVNLSAVQFKRGDLLDVVTRALERSALDPASLELEITESALVRDSDTVMRTVERLRELGVAFSIDDFGTGYSSLAYLKRFKVDKLKIDQSFVRGIAQNTSDAAIVRTIVEMARSLGLITIAEGIETADVLECLRQCGCDQAQGYYLGRPMPAAAFAEVLAESPPHREGARL